MSKTLKSPVTKTSNVIKVLSIPINDIYETYHAERFSDIDKYLSGRTKNIDIYECLDSGYRFYYPFNIFGDDKFYEYLQKLRPHYSHNRWEHQPALDLINKNKKVLEIGSGSGDFLKNARNRALYTQGLEFNNKAVQVSKKKGLNVIKESIQEHAKKKPEYYDMVCMFQVLEHVYDVQSFLEASVKTLKRGGKLIIGVPNNNPYLFRYDILHALNLPPHHSGLWNKYSLNYLADIFGLRIDNINTEPLHDLDYYWYIQQRHRKQNSIIIYWLCRPLSLKIFRKPRNMLLNKFCDGRNILAIYTKK